MFCAGSESDKKSSVDQAFRDELLHLVVNIISTIIIMIIRYIIIIIIIIIIIKHY